MSCAGSLSPPSKNGQNFEPSTLRVARFPPTSSSKYLSTSLRDWVNEAARIYPFWHWQSRHLKALNVRGLQFGLEFRLGLGVISVATIATGCESQYGQADNKTLQFTHAMHISFPFVYCQLSFVPGRFIANKLRATILTKSAGHYCFSPGRAQVKHGFLNSNLNRRPRPNVVR